MRLHPVDHGAAVTAAQAHGHPGAIQVEAAEAGARADAAGAGGAGAN